MSKQPEPHDMRYKANKQKMYGTVANRNVVHHSSQQFHTKKEAQEDGRKTKQDDSKGQKTEGE